MQISKPTNRRKTIYWITGALSSLVFLKFSWMPGRKKQKGNTVKMLTQDGQLVEVDEQYLSSQRRKVSTDEIQNFVTQKK